MIPEDPMNNSPKARKGIDPLRGDGLQPPEAASTVANDAAHWLRSGCSSMVLFAALELRVFDRLEGPPLLMDALVAVGLLLRAKGGYEPTEFASRYLRAGSPDYLGQLILTQRHFWSAMLDLPSVLAADEAGNQYRNLRTPTYLDDFSAGWGQLVRRLPEAVARVLSLPARGHLLDLGCGDGYQACHLLAGCGMTGTLVRPADRCPLRSRSRPEATPRRPCGLPCRRCARRA